MTYEVSPKPRAPYPSPPQEKRRPLPRRGHHPQDNHPNTTKCSPGWLPERCAVVDRGLFDCELPAKSSVVCREVLPRLWIDKPRWASPSARCRRTSHPASNEVAAAAIRGELPGFQRRLPRGYSR
jgi:hypothetical protein